MWCAITHRKERNVINGKIIELQTVKGQKQKIAILKKYCEDENFCKFLYYALNPLITYNLSEKTLNSTEEKYLGATVLPFNSIFECCDYLSRLRGMDLATTRQVRYFLYNNCEEDDRDLYIKLLSKTLRLGVTAKTVNKVIPNLIPEWEVQQAFPIDKYPLAENTEFWVSEKLNGVRATFYNGRFIARSGSEITGLDHIIKDISWTNAAGIVLDGELTLKDRTGLSDNEAFRKATGIINSDSMYKTDICYTFFDAIPLLDFDTASPKVQYEYRRTIIDEVQKTIGRSDNVEAISCLYHGTDQSMIPRLLEKMVNEDKEGLMINLNVPYKRCRHKGILKVKQFYSMDLPIIRCEEGTGRLAGTLGALVLDYKGNEVKVGSGFTDDQRKEFWENRENLDGILCEVKYKEVSYEKESGAESLQFPVFICLRENKAEISYG